MLTLNNNEQMHTRFQVRQKVKIDISIPNMKQQQPKSNHI